jgi:uncharacterized protein (DUF1684 family)
VRNRFARPGVRIGVDVEALRRFRAMKDEFFATDPSSPLTPTQRARFRGLAYFPPNSGFAVEGEMRPCVTRDEVDLVTSYGDTARYRRAGVVWFEVDGIPGVITLFRSKRGDLFVPFRDATSGTETYGAGRYLEARSLGYGRALLDFNYAYNPYCAYSPEWRCPIPPIENHLIVPIRAGEMRYRDAEPTRTADGGRVGNHRGPPASVKGKGARRLRLMTPWRR